MRPSFRAPFSCSNHAYRKLSGRGSRQLRQNGDELRDLVLRHVFSAKLYDVIALDRSALNVGSQEWTTRIVLPLHNDVANSGDPANDCFNFSGVDLSASDIYQLSDSSLELQVSFRRHKAGILSYVVVPLVQVAREIGLIRIQVGRSHGLGVDPD